MPNRLHNWLTFTSGTLANRTNSRRCVMQVLSFHGIGYPPRLRTIVDSEKCYLCLRTSVTYVSGLYKCSSLGQRPRNIERAKNEALKARYRSIIIWEQNVPEIMSRL